MKAFVLVLPLAFVVASCGGDKKTEGDKCQRVYENAKKRVGEEPARTHFLPECLRVEELRKAVEAGKGPRLERACDDVERNSDYVEDESLRDACGDLEARFESKRHEAPALTAAEIIPEIDRATEQLELARAMCQNARGIAANEGSDPAAVDRACTANESAGTVRRAAEAAKTAATDTATPKQRTAALRDCRAALFGIELTPDDQWAKNASQMFFDACFVDLAKAIAKQPRAKNYCGRAAECCSGELHDLVVVALDHELLPDKPSLRAALGTDPACKAMIDGGRRKRTP